MQLNLKELVEAGAHFGHRPSHTHPRMLPYVYGKRNFIYIIDLRLTVKGLISACKYLEKVAQQGKEILFVGTKRVARTVIEEAAKRCGMPYVSQRWLGGTLTNFSTIRARLSRLDEIEAIEKDGRYEMLTKKERSVLMHEKRKLVRNLEGIRNMQQIPSILVVVDPHKENIAIKEAKSLGLNIVAIIDTDGDPEGCDFLIPCNDDSMRVLQIILNKLADAIVEGKKYLATVVEITQKQEVSELKTDAQHQSTTVEMSEATTPENINKEN